MADIDHAGETRPSAGHTAAAWFKLAWLGIVASGAGFIAFRRAFGCFGEDGLWGYACSFRMAGLTLLIVDFLSLWTLLWFAAGYDTDPSEADKSSMIRRPHVMLMAAARASRQRSTPHRWKHRIGFWIFVAMVGGFAYLVYGSHIASV